MLHELNVTQRLGILRWIWHNTDMCIIQTTLCNFLVEVLNRRSHQTADSGGVMGAICHPAAKFTPGLAR